MLLLKARPIFRRIITRNLGMPVHQQTLGYFFSTKGAQSSKVLGDKRPRSPKTTPLETISQPNESPVKSSRKRAKRVVEDDEEEEDVEPANGSVQDVKMEDDTESETLKEIKQEIKKEAEVKDEPMDSAVDDDIESHKKRIEIKDARDLLQLDKQTHAGGNKGSSKLVKNKPIPYSSLCGVFQNLEDETGRLKNLAIASEYFVDVMKKSDSATSLIEVTYLMINRLGPDYEPDLELGLGESILLKALSQSTGREVSRIREDYHKYGDIGKVAQVSRSRQPIMFKPKPLTVDQVFKNLTEIAKSTGNSSQSRKIGIINRMLAACDGEEAKFLMRSLEGKLRINFGEKSVLVALAKAFVEYEAEGAEPEADDLVQAEEEIKQAFSQTPNYEMIIRNALEHGISTVSKYCKLQPGIPVKPMLAKPTKSITEIMDTLQTKPFTCEYKYDGERAQVHLMEDGHMRVYSRSSENMTERYPDLIPVIDQLKAENPNIKSMILDSECVAYDTEQDKILPFQVLSTRKRKDVLEKDIKVHVCLFVFDMLFFNGDSLIQLPLNERRKFLYDNVKVIPNKLQFATKLDSENTDEISRFLDQSVKDSCEGLMIKTVDGSESRYEPSKRSRNWLKLKKDYLEGVGDSLDLVVIGGYIGKGKRTGWYGGFLLAAYNQDTGEYESVCKIGTGFSEELLAKLTEELKPQEIEKPKAFYIYDKEDPKAKPDIWFEPSMVFEVKVADLTTSPIYKCGASYFGNGEKGISLRFPRFIQVRADKSTEDATSSEQIVEMYESQAVIQ